MQTSMSLPFMATTEKVPSPVFTIDSRTVSQSAIPVDNKEAPSELPRRNLTTTLRSYKRQIMWLMFYALLQILLYGMGCLQYMRDPDTTRPYFTAALVAMGFGMVLQVNCGIFLFMPALRRTTTFLKRSWVAKYFPFDSLIGFHIVVATIVCAAAAGHVTARLINFYFYSLTLEARNHNVTYNAMLSESGVVGAEFLGYTVISGWVALACLIVIGVFALPPLRNSKLYDVFYWTHKLQFVLWTALIVHAPDFWKFACIPLVLYFGEKFWKYATVVRWAPSTKAKETYELPGEVTHLTIKRPKEFIYYPGNYCFIKAPSLGISSWHPFTISSYPEQHGRIGFHIKASGNATKKFGKLVHKRVETRRPALERFRSSASVETIEKHTMALAASIKTFLKPLCRTVNDQIFLDGPYASSGAELFSTEHAVFIGAGIGVTPFMSILGSLLAQSKLAKHTTCPSCDHHYRPFSALEPLRINGRRLKLKRVDFIWVTKDTEHIAWLAQLLQDWDEYQPLPEKTHFLRYQIYVTNPKPGELEEAQTKYGLRTKPLSGRPNWPSVFQEFEKQKPKKLRVFYCGPPAMEGVLREHCGQFKFDFSWENF